MISIMLESEITTSREPARVRVYENGELVGAAEARIEYEEGADGGYYPVVKLQQVNDLKTIPV